MAENRFSKGVKEAKERTAEIEAQKAINPETKEDVIKEKYDKVDVGKILSEASKKKNGTAKTFYMTEENMNKLEKIAKAQKISVSKVLNEILSNVL